MYSKIVSLLRRVLLYIAMTLALCVASFSKDVKKSKASSAPPEWVSDYKTLYSDDIYITGFATCDSVSEAVDSAIRQVESYFSGDGISDDGSDIGIREYLTLLTYYDKKAKVYYALSYISKEGAFNLFNERVQVAREDFNNIFNDAATQSNLLNALLCYNESKICNKKLKECIRIASIVAPTPNYYDGDLLIDTLIEDALKKTKGSIALFTNIFTLDTSGFFSGALKESVEELLSNCFKGEGFNITKRPRDYLLDVYVALNVKKSGHGKDAAYEYGGGSVSVSLKYLGDGDTCYTFIRHFTGDGALYKYDALYKIVTLSITGIINENLKEDLKNNF